MNDFIELFYISTEEDQQDVLHIWYNLFADLNVVIHIRFENDDHFHDTFTLVVRHVGRVYNP